MFGKVSLGSIGLVVGTTLTVIGFIAYARGNATLNLAGLFYGVPLLLGGLALKASELKPVIPSQPASEAVIELREKQATPTQKQIRKDVTRYRYGQEAHLDVSLEKLGLSPSDAERPILVDLREEAIADQYTLVLVFDSPAVDLTTWQSKQEKMEKFFGPDVQAKIQQTEADLIELSLISTV